MVVVGHSVSHDFLNLLMLVISFLFPILVQLKYYLIIDRDLVQFYFAIKLIANTEL